MTLSVAGIFKEIATILLSSNVFGDELTPINVTGLCIALTGIGLYNYLKYRLLMRNNLDQGSHRLEESCTEMGGNALPSSGGGGVGGVDERDGYAQVSLGGAQVELEGEAVELTKEELERRRQREDEADLAGWHHSGTIRTGDGYDEDGSDHTP
jgi:solute carrier family 35 protein C2